MNTRLLNIFLGLITIKLRWKHNLLTEKKSQTNAHYNDACKMPIFNQQKLLKHMASNHCLIVFLTFMQCFGFKLMDVLF